MSPENSNLRRLPRPGPFAQMASGRQALREVPGLRLFLLKGFLLNYAIFICLAAAAYYLIFFLLVEPYSEELGEWVSNEGILGDGILWQVLSILLTLVEWLTKMLLLAATIMLSLLFSLALMSMWFEALAARIVTHCRGGVAESRGRFSIFSWLAGIGRSLRESLFLVILAGGALLLGLVPVVGPLLVILVDGYLLGWEVRDPYLTAREALGDERRQLRKGLMLWTVQAGILPVFLAMIPILGWIFLPMVMVYLVAGFAWNGERALLEGGE